MLQGLYKVLGINVAVLTGHAVHLGKQVLRRMLMIISEQRCHMRCWNLSYSAGVRTDHSEDLLGKLGQEEGGVRSGVRVSSRKSTLIFECEGPEMSSSWTLRRTEKAFEWLGEGGQGRCGWRCGLGWVT